jgi:hypothetical protein
VTVSQFEQSIAKCASSVWSSATMKPSCLSSATSDRESVATPARDEATSSTMRLTSRSLTEAIDTTSAGGQLQVHLFVALTEFERSLGQERTRAGLEAAPACGRIGGRPAVVTNRKLIAAIAMRDGGT